MREEYTPVAKSEFLQEVAQLFVGRSGHASEGLNVIEQSVLNAAQKHDEELTIQWLDIFDEIVCKTLPPANDVSLNDYCKRLQNLYWHLFQNEGMKNVRCKHYHRYTR